MVFQTFTSRVLTSHGIWYACRSEFYVCHPCLKRKNRQWVSISIIGPSHWRLAAQAWSWWRQWNYLQIPPQCPCQGWCLRHSLEFRQRKNTFSTCRVSDEATLVHRRWDENHLVKQQRGGKRLRNFLLICISSTAFLVSPAMDTKGCTMECKVSPSLNVFLCVVGPPIRSIEVSL